MINLTKDVQNLNSENYKILQDSFCAHGLEAYVFYTIPIRISTGFFFFLINQEVDSKIHIKIQTALNRQNNY